MEQSKKEKIMKRRLICRNVNKKKKLRKGKGWNKINSFCLLFHIYTTLTEASLRQLEIDPDNKDITPIENTSAN